MVDRVRNPLLIVLYGRHTLGLNAKQQRMIDGTCTCMYREYAEQLGFIVYLAQQTLRHRHDLRFTSLGLLQAFLNRSDLRSAVVLSIKHDPLKDRLLQCIPQRRAYYSCCANDCLCEAADVSLVDTQERVAGNARVWFKGKNPDVWRPSKEPKQFDYLLMGRRGDKNEEYFLQRLDQEVQSPRSVLWIGGKEHEGRIHTRHTVTYTAFSGPGEVARLIPLAHVGVLFTEHPSEGFPQSLLEMVMCGVPVVYNKAAPWNVFYAPLEDNDAVLRTTKPNLVEACESMLRRPPDTIRHRERFTTQRSFEYMEKLCTR